MKRDRKKRYNALAALVTLGVLAAGWLLCGPASGLLVGVSPNMAELCRRCGVWLYAIGGFICVTCLLAWSIRHQLYKGVRYAFTHAALIRGIEWALLETGTDYSISIDDKFVDLPPIKLELSKDLSQGIVRIRNHIKYDGKLESVNLSSMLGKYIVENSYLSDDENWYIYEFADSSVDNQLVFHSYKEFAEYAQKCGDYQLFMDKKSHVPLSSLLLVGATGSGKTYALYGLIYQLINWCVKPVLYFADPKNSSLCVLGKRLAPQRTAGTTEEIIAQLEEFHRQMMVRKEELQTKLEEKLDADYRYWSLPAYIFVFDEFAAFQSVIATMDKKQRDKVSMLLRNIVLQGRQLGFFLWVVMQKSDSTDIPTSIRDNLIWKVVLGSATNTTYLTCFEHAADLPKRKFGPGQGLYSYQGLTIKPQITSFAHLDFDILGAITTQEPPPRSEAEAAAVESVPL